MNARLITSSALMALSGCALNPEYVASLDSWVGAPVVDFFAEHREPDSMVDMIDYRIYVWDNTSISTHSVQGNIVCTGTVDLGNGMRSTPNCQTYGGGAYSLSSSCAWKLRVRDDVITEVELLGDSCGSDERPVARTTLSPAGS
jgi:hypothetical protein